MPKRLWMAAPIRVIALSITGDEIARKGQRAILIKMA